MILVINSTDNTVCPGKKRAENNVGMSESLRTLS